MDAQPVRHLPVESTDECDHCDWYGALGLLLALVFCVAFWFGVGWGISLLVGVAEAKPKPDPPPHALRTGPDPAGYSCTYSGVIPFKNGATSSAVCVKVK